MKDLETSNFNTVISRIKNLEENNSLSKHECIVQGILEAIDASEVVINDQLPSINYFVENLGYARETFAKAYRELIQHGIVKSKKRKGYFVISENTELHQKIAILLYAYDTFQETLVTQLKKHLQKENAVDLYFHHNNIQTFTDILNKINGQYTVYIIAPIDSDSMEGLLGNISPSKLLIIDRYLDLGVDYSYISQEFEKSTFQVFEQLYPKIVKYEELIFFFKDGTAEPKEIKNAFLQFINKYKLNGRVDEKFNDGDLAKNKMYFTIHNHELYRMLKEAIEKGWTLGKELGVLSHNDDVVKEIISGGITTFSVDFGEIGRRAAEFVLTRKKTRVILPTVLKDRNSI